MNVVRQNVTKEAESKITNHKTVSKGKQYDQYLIYIPKDVQKDSTFPFAANQKVIVRIDNGRLIIEKA